MFFLIVSLITMVAARGLGLGHARGGPGMGKIAAFDPDSPALLELEEPSPNHVYLCTEDGHEISGLQQNAGWPNTANDGAVKLKAAINGDKCRIGATLTTSNPTSWKLLGTGAQNTYKVKCVKSSASIFSFGPVECTDSTFIGSISNAQKAQLLGVPAGSYSIGIQGYSQPAAHSQ